MSPGGQALLRSVRRLLVVCVGLCVGFLAHCTPPLSGPEATSDAALADQISTPDASALEESAGAEEGAATPTTTLALSTGQPLQYQLRWSWDGARWDAAASAYIFTTALGYTVGIEAAYVGTAALQMVACEAPSEAHRMGWLPWRWSFGVRRARAEHSFTNDASLVSQPKVEVVHTKESLLFGTATSSGVTYCQLHILYAPLTQEAADGVSIKRSSAVLKGWYQAAGSTKKVPFAAQTSLTGGSLVQLEGHVGEVAGVAPWVAGVEAQVVLTRRPVLALQDADFAKLAPVELAYHFLQRLSRASQVLVARP